MEFIVTLNYEWQPHHEWDADITQIDGKVVLDGTVVQQLDIYRTDDEAVTKAEKGAATGIWRLGKVAVMHDPVPALLVPDRLTEETVYAAIALYLRHQRVDL